MDQAGYGSMRLVGVHIMGVSFWVTQADPPLKERETLVFGNLGCGYIHVIFP
jgi:hypothetical protein